MKRELYVEVDRMVLRDRWKSLGRLDRVASLGEGEGKVISHGLTIGEEK